MGFCLGQLRSDVEVCTQLSTNVTVSEKQLFQYTMCVVTRVCSVFHCRCAHGAPSSPTRVKTRPVRTSKPICHEVTLTQTLNSCLPLPHILREMDITSPLELHTALSTWCSSSPGFDYMRCFDYQPHSSSSSPDNSHFSPIGAYHSVRILASRLDPPDLKCMTVWCEVQVYLPMLYGTATPTQM